MKKTGIDEKSLLIYFWSSPDKGVPEEMSRLQALADELHCEPIAIHINPKNRKSTIKMLLTRTSMNIRYPNLFDNGTDSFMMVKAQLTGLRRKTVTLFVS